MNEDEFELDGKVYTAIEKAKSMSRCFYCAFDKNWECLERNIPACGNEVRKDGRNVIFVEKQQ